MTTTADYPTPSKEERSEMAKALERTLHRAMDHAEDMPMCDVDAVLVGFTCDVIEDGQLLSVEAVLDAFPAAPWKRSTVA